MGRISAALVAVAVLAGCGTGHSHRYTAPADLSESDWSDPLEMDRAWRASRVLVPRPGDFPRDTSIGELLEADTDPVRGLHPTVIYLHGCAGLGPASDTRMNYLARMGYAVIAPDSLAREKYPQSCEPGTRRSGMYRGTVPLRVHDTAYAVARARELDWVDAGRMAMFGASEGGLITAVYPSGSPEGWLRARVIEGWTCQSAVWSEYRGIRAPASEPVLALVAKYDPWYQNPWTRGDCAEFLDRGNGSRSVVYAEGDIAYAHALFEHEAVAERVAVFLGKHLGGPHPPPEGRPESPSE